MQLKRRLTSQTCFCKMGILRFNKFHFGFAAIFHFMAHATTAFFYCCIADGSRLKLIATIELLDTNPKTGSSIYAEQ
jgi:hypothetical protein